MNDPAYTGAPGAMPYDPEHDAPSAVPAASMCRDCGVAADLGASSVSDILSDGSLFSAVYCGPCVAWRVAREWLFDPRPKVLLEALAPRKDAAV